MSSPPQDPGSPGHPYEPARSTPPRYTSPGWPEGAGHNPGQHRAATPAPSQLQRLLGLTMASGTCPWLSGGVVTIIYTTMDFAAMYQRMGMPAEDADQVGTMVEQVRGVSIDSGVIGLVVLGGLYAMEYVFLRQGVNSAWILGIVLATLSAVGFLGNSFGFWLYGQWAIVLIAIGIAFIAVSIAWLVTALRAPLRAWSSQQRYAGEPPPAPGRPTPPRRARSERMNSRKEEPVSEPLVRIEDFRMAVKNTTVIEDQSFDVHAGETFGFLSSNGSGRTTTLNCWSWASRPQGSTPSAAGC